MRAAQCLVNGPPDSVVVADFPTPVPDRGQVLVDVHAASLNYPDALQIQGLYQVKVPTPFIPGSEFAGVVSALGPDVGGPDVGGLTVGDRVLGGMMVGAFAEQVVMSAKALSPVPEGMSFEDASAFRVTYRTSYSALRSVAEVAKDEWVCVLGAAGGVGSAAIDLSKLLGARVIAVASTEDKRQRCLAWGADVAIGYENLKDDLRARTDGGAHVVIDPVGGPAAEQALRSTRWGGRFVTIGFASGEIPRIPLNLVLLKGVIVKGFEIRTFGDYAPELQARDDRELDALAEAGLRPRVEATYPLERVADALRAIAAREVTGKVVITMR